MNAQNVGGVYYTVDLDTRRLLTESPRVGRELRAVEFRMGAVALAVQGLAAALALLKMAAVADEMRLLGARVQVAAGSVERGAAAMAELQRISARTQTEVAANVQVFTRLNSSITQMGGTQQDTLRITELLAKAIKVSGASGVEAASAMTQFGQALGSGKLAGDELRSLLENAPYLMRQLADGIGVPVGALKDLGEQGKLTADVVVAALSRAATTIDADFKKLPQTFEAAMGALVDQLRRASEAADTLTGTSALLTGAAKGASDAVGLFADQLVRMVSESDKLGRNDAIGEWSRRTTLVLSYVADAADITWQTLSVLGRNVGFVFATVGDRLGNLAAQAKAIVNGDAAGAEALEREFRAVAAARRSALDAADAQTLGRRQLSGQAMRERLAALDNGTGGYQDRSDRLTAPASRLKSPGGGDDGKKGKKRETEAEIKARQDLARIKRVDEAEQQADEEARARQDAANEQANADNTLRIRQEEETAKAIQAARDRLATLAIGNDPVARAKAEQEAVLKQLQIDLDAQYISLEEFNTRKVALEQETADRIKAITDQRVRDEQAAYGALLGGASDFFAASSELLKRNEGEQSDSYKAMFALSKGFAIAQGTIALYQAALDAMKTGLTVPQKLANYAAVFGAGATLLNTIKGVQYGGGRQYGGPVSAGSLYRVNETGQPEMFVGSGGRQYLMPTTSGQVVPADQVGGGGAVVELRVINQHAGAQVTARTGSDGRPEVIISEVAAQIRDHRGPVWGALSGSTNVRPRL